MSRAASDRFRRTATWLSIAVLVVAFLASGSSSSPGVSAGHLLVTGSGADASATIVCRPDGTVVTERFTWSNFTDEPAVGPAYPDDIRFVRYDGGTASVRIPEYKSEEHPTGVVKGLRREPSTGVTSAQLVFPEAAYYVQYRCPDGSGPYQGTVTKLQRDAGPNLEVGFTVAPGNASLAGLILYSDVAPSFDRTGYTFPFLLARDTQPKSILPNGSFNFSVPAKLIATDGNASEHVVHIAGKISGQGDATGTLDMADVSGTLDGGWQWEATTGYGALAVPIISPLKHPASNKAALLEVTNLVYPGGLGFTAPAQSSSGGSLTGGPPAAAVYQPPHIGVTLPDAPYVQAWGREEDDRDRATVVYAVSAPAASVFNWYVQQLSERGWTPGSKTQLIPGGGVTNLHLEMFKGSLDIRLTAEALPACPATYCATFAGELKLPMLLTIQATGNTSANPAVNPVTIPPLCPTPVVGASLVMRGMFSGTATSTCLGLWTSRNPDGTCSGIMHVDYVIDGIPFEFSVASGHTAPVIAWGISDVSISSFTDSYLAPNSDDQPAQVAGGMLSLHEHLYWHVSESPVETLTARIPCQGLSHY